MKGRPIVIAVVAGTAGLAVGVLSTAWFMSRFLTHAQATSAVATLAVDGLALQNIHDGDPDAATQLLQARLDGELLTISWEIKAGYVLTPQARKAISRVKRLRESSGYEPSDPEVRRDVHATLALGGTNE
jgi:hypothetical protein